MVYLWYGVVRDLFCLQNCLRVIGMPFEIRLKIMSRPKRMMQDAVQIHPAILHTILLIHEGKFWIQNLTYLMKPMMVHFMKWL